MITGGLPPTASWISGHQSADTCQVTAVLGTNVQSLPSGLRLERTSMTACQTLAEPNRAHLRHCSYYSFSPYSSLSSKTRATEQS